MSSNGYGPDQEAAGLRPRPVRLIAQYFKFGMVGSAATVTHVVAFGLWIEVAGMTPLGANVAAFGVAIVIGFLGHFYWTFRRPHAHHMSSWQAALVKFVVVSLAGLALNSLAVYVVVNMLAMSYVYAVALMVTVVPVGTFVLSRSWAFL